MKTMMILTVGMLIALGTASVPVTAAPNAQAPLWDQSRDRNVAHGGGCRKNSPAGQCCHMDRKAGTVHCH